MRIILPQYCKLAQYIRHIGHFKGYNKECVIKIIMVSDNMPSLIEIVYFKLSLQIITEDILFFLTQNEFQNLKEEN